METAFLILLHLICAAQSLKIKLALLFAFNTNIFKVFNNKRHLFNIESLILKLSKLPEWRCDLNLLTSSLLSFYKTAVFFALM